MNYQFHYSVPMDEEMGILFGIAYAVILAVSLLVGLVFYAMRAYAVYSIAKRRGMRKPWLAWVPVANSWVLGALSDQYRHLIKGEIRQKRKLLLGFAAGNAVLAGVVSAVAGLVSARVMATGAAMSDGQLASELMGPVIALLIVGGLVGLLRLTEYVLQKMCMLDLYRSCDPGNAVAYLVLGILFGVLDPIFLICIRRKDYGMVLPEDYE